jgi:hypothetical protein
MILSQCDNWWSRSDAQGQKLPRHLTRSVAALPLITDTTADVRRGRNGPLADSCIAAFCAGRSITSVACEKHSAADVFAKAHAVLPEIKSLWARFDVGYFPPSTLPDR